MNARMPALLLPALLLVPAAAAQSYSMLDLATLGPFPDAMAYGLSNNGKITGVGTNLASGEIHAFLYQGGAIQDLGKLGYLYGSDGIAVNDAGQVACTGYGPGWQALLYDNGHVTHIGNIDGGFSEGLAINALGHVVGKAQMDNGGFQGFSWIGGAFQPLNVDIARGINASDQIAGSVGYYWTQGGYVIGTEHACVVSGGVIQDLGNIGGGVKTPTEACAINDAGQVTGYSTAADGTQHAFLYSGGVMTDLGTIAPYYTKGVSINASAQIVGEINTYVGGPAGSFLDSGGEMKDLSTLLDGSGAGWSGLLVKQINDSGWIVGYGTVNGETHGFLAKPNPTWSALGSGLAGSNGVPSLAGSGALTAGSSGSLSLTSANASSPVVLFVSLASTPAPFKGGTLLAFPAVVTVPLATDAGGALLLPFTWPAGIPAATALYFQDAVKDAAAINGVALSNALKAVTP